MEVPSKAKLNVSMHILLYTIDFIFGTFQADTRALKLNAWKQLALEEGMYLIHFPYMCLCGFGISAMG